MPDTVTYTASLAATGTDNFTYHVSDGNGGTDTVRVDITIDNPLTNFVEGSGDDTLITGLGNDVIDGGLGSDSVIFSGEKSAYSITEVGKNVVITDNQEGRDGSDTLSSIENFQFSDGTFQLAQLLNVTDIDRGIYRFFNLDTGTYFLSGSTVERDSIINNLDSFNFEGPIFKAADPTTPSADTVFHFFNTDTGTHFYTAAEAEKDSILANLPSFNFEGTAYWVDLVMN